MNFANIIFYDWETCSINPKATQPLQLAAVVIDGRRLEPIGDFVSYIKPIVDKEEQIKLGLDDIQPEALKKNKITEEQYMSAPDCKTVWGLFTDWVNQYNYKKERWFAPIKAGYNNNNFDDIILDRICCRSPYKFGPSDKKYDKEALFHPIHNIDLMKIMFQWFENDYQMKSLSFDSLRNHLGMDTSKAHDALFDCKQGAALLIKILKLTREFSKKVKFAKGFINE